MDTAITLASIPAILALVNLCKEFGLTSKLALIVAIVLGVALNAADVFLAANVVYQACADGLILGLSAAGLYDASKLASKAAA